MADLKATERTTAKMLGVGSGTAHRDREIAPNGAKSKIQSLKSQEKINNFAPNGAPTPSILTKSGQDVARLIEKVAKLEE